MAFTKKEKAAVKALVSCHETGKPVGNYSALVVLNDGAGITYGCHQATHGSGSLYKIVKMYCDISNSETSKALEPYLAGLKNAAKRFEYAKIAKLKTLLKEAGNEQAMRYAQNEVFDVNYFKPALRAVEGSGWVTPLALAVVYDSMIQGGWLKIRDRVNARNEKEWIKQFVAARRKWLASSSKQVVRNSVYRMTTFESLMAKGNWSLNVPFVVHGATVTNAHLSLWIAGEDINKEPKDIPDAPSIVVSDEIQPLLEGNTEGIAEDEEMQTDEENQPIEGEVKEPVEEDGAKVGEPVPDEPAKEGEAIVGGRPNDQPVIIPKVEPEPTSGWKTWSTSVTGVLSSIGVSGAALGTWFWGAITDPTSSSFALVLVIIGIVAAGLFAIIYLIIRAKDKARREQHAHEIMLEELKLRSIPDRYNVKVDRRTIERTEEETAKAAENAD
jgi:hypothetical protein